MPWTYDDPPAVAENWDDDEIVACVDAANAVLDEGGNDEEAIFACIHAAGRSERKMTSMTKRQAVLRVFPLRDIHVRAQGEDGPAIEGYAAVFDQISEDLGGFREVIKPGAFTKTLKEADVRATFNHDPNYVLGRMGAGTLEISQDEHGLPIRARPPDTQWARDLMVSMERGDIDQMSFLFRSIVSHWEEPDPEGGRDFPLWVQEEVRLADVAVVTFPAYPQTEAHVRALGYQLFIPEPPQAGHSEGDSITRLQAQRAMRRRRLELWKR